MKGCLYYFCHFFRNLKIFQNIKFSQFWGFAPSSVPSWLCNLEQVTSPLCACFCVYKTDIGLTTLQASSVLPACGCFTADLGSDGA